MPIKQAIFPAILCRNITTIVQLDMYLQIIAPVYYSEWLVPLLHHQRFFYE
jgi:hypothetical protein